LSAYVNFSIDPSSETIFLTEQDLEIIEGKESLRIKIAKGPRRQYEDSDDESFLDHSSKRSDDENDEDMKSDRVARSSQDSD